MKYAYYPGCSLNTTAAEYGDSFKGVCKKLDIELNEVDDWVCCGTTPSHATSKLLAASLPIYNLLLARKTGSDTLLVPCSSCYSRFKTAVFNVNKDVQLKEKVEKVLESEFVNCVDIKHPLELFSNLPELGNLSERISTGLKGMKIACYYGCLLTRPPEITGFDSTEYPMSMDKILREAGAETVDWSYKTECCGASLALTRTDIVERLCHDILENAKECGAKAISVACPLCQNNLDLWQERIERKYNAKFFIPVFYFTQLMGIALGISPLELGLSKLMVSADNLLEEIGVK